jgi:hypothetical protein
MAIPEKHAPDGTLTQAVNREIPELIKPVQTPPPNEPGTNFHG